jgi:hypothetical protein
MKQPKKIKISFLFIGVRHNSRTFVGFKIIILWPDLKIHLEKNLDY